MKRIPSLALGRHLLVIAGLVLASTVGNLSADDTYYVSDHLATTSAVADAAGEIASLEADAFGSPVSGGEPAARYTGKPYDADIGAYVFPFRNYRSDEARWMSTDPSGFPDGLNGRRYAANVFTDLDPTGLVVNVYVSGTSTSVTNGALTMNVDYGARRVGALVQAEMQVNWSIQGQAAGFVVQHITITRDTVEEYNFFEAWEISADGIWVNGAYDFYNTGSQSSDYGNIVFNGDVSFYTAAQVSGSSPANWGASSQSHPAHGLPVTETPPSWFTAGGITHNLRLTWGTE